MTQASYWTPILPYPLGHVSAALDDYAGAMKQYEQVLSVEPDRLQERFELATLLRPKQLDLVQHCVTWLRTAEPNPSRPEP